MVTSFLTPHVHVGLQYKHGHASDEDTASALKLFTLAADQGNTTAAYFAGLCVQSDDEKAAVAWFEQSCGLSEPKGGSSSPGRPFAPGFIKLARCYELGRGVDKDPERAASLYGRGHEELQKAAGDSADSEVLFTLAECFRFGYGVPASHEKGAEYMRRAAEAGHPNAQFIFASSYLTKTESEHDLRRWMHQAASQGHSSALHWCKLNPATALI